MRPLPPLCLFFYLCVIIVDAQCPTTIRSPCNCATTRYEPITIVCDNAGNLQNVIASVGEVLVLIDSLKISNTPIVELPAFAFPNLAIKRLELSNNGLVSIHPNAFDTPIAHTLMELEIRHNSIGEIPQSGIPALQALRVLVLSKCGIHAVTANSFATYGSRTLMTRLDLSSNRLQTIDARAFDGLTAIKEMSFFKNFLTAVPTEALANLATLEDLALGVNNIRSVAVGALRFPALKSLSLEANHVESIPRDAFQTTTNLLYLYVSNNRFTQISPDMFYYIPRLRVLYMGGNERLERITTNAFQYVPDLVRLELPDCSIHTIEDGALERIPRVQVIDLRANALTQLTALTFPNLARLISLNLHGNLLSDVHDSTFAHLPALKHLDLGDNALTALDASTFLGTFERTMPATSRVLYLSDNPWACTTRIAWLRRWLRDETDVSIDRPAANMSACASPPSLLGVRLREVDPVVGSNLVTSAPFGQLTANVNMAGVSSGSFDLGVAAVIMGIILGILILSLVLLLVIRFYVAKSKALDDDEDRLAGGSATTSSYRPTSTYGGSAYPADPIAFVRPQTASALSLRQRPQHIYGEAPGDHESYFLNRPWYWWF